MMGCRFNRPSGLVRAEDILEPIGVDLISAATDFAAAANLFGAYYSARSTQGHIVDLGTRIDRLGGGVALARMLIPAAELTRLAPDALSRSLLALALRDVRILERYAQGWITG